MAANLVFSPGIDAFYAQCARVGVDSVLVADVPVEESPRSARAAMRHNIAPIFICPPNADDDLLRQIASYGRGYTYLLSRAGVTVRKIAPRCRCTTGGEAGGISRRAAAAGLWHLRAGAGERRH